MTDMKEKFNSEWNIHYNFEDSNNIIEIVRQEHIDHNGISSLPAYKAGGGERIQSPWGMNQTVDAGQYPLGNSLQINADRLANPDDVARFDIHPQEFCRKVLVINPFSMLSLQKHRGRQEIWEVTEGILTVILDGKKYELQAGQKICIPLGAPHCMINVHDVATTVHELQTGVCREGDNIRLLDFSDRPIYPITSEAEHVSVTLYANIRRDLASRKAREFDGYLGL